MGDLSEMRGLITVVTFMGFFVLLLAWIPPEMYTVGQYREVYTPEEFEAIEVYSFADYDFIYLNESSGHIYWADSSIWIYEDLNIGGWDMDFYYKRPNETGLSWKMIHEHTEWWGLLADHHGLALNDRSGVDRRENDYCTVESIEENAESNGYTSRWRAVCPHFTVYTIFSFNITTYATFENAWNFGELRVFWGINFEDVNTSYNAFQLISMLLFFSFPSMPVYIQAPMSIITWVCVCYLLFIFITKVIPFIGGG